MTAAAPVPPRLPRPWRLTVDRYLRMIEGGILTEKDRVFLWKGRIFKGLPKSRPHVVTLMQLLFSLDRVVRAVGYVEQGAPVMLLRHRDTLPEPDLKVVRGRPEDYREYPTVQAVPLVIEVADSSLSFDRSKLKVYGAESIPISWIANIPDRQVEVYTDPTGPETPAGYGACSVYRPGSEVPVVLDGTEVGRIAVDEIFPQGGLTA